MPPALPPLHTAPCFHGFWHCHPYTFLYVIYFTLFLQHYSNLSDTDRDNLQTLLYTVINKYKYDKDYNFTTQV